MLICAAQYEAFAKIYDRVFGFSRPTRILLLGLDAAGKTSVLYKLKLDELVTTIPTIGFNVEEVNYKNLSMTMWDVGGQDKIRRLWSHYYENSDAIVYVGTPLAAGLRALRAQASRAPCAQANEPRLRPRQARSSR